LSVKTAIKYWSIRVLLDIQREVSVPFAARMGESINPSATSTPAAESVLPGTAADGKDFLRQP